MEENKEVYYLYDIETGHSYPVSKKVYEMTLDMWKSVMPKLEDVQIKGSVIITGTAGHEGVDYDSLKRLFEDPSSEKFKPLNIKWDDKPIYDGVIFKLKADKGWFGIEKE
jgi:hypothetical protein